MLRAAISQMPNISLFRYPPPPPAPAAAPPPAARPPQHEKTLNPHLASPLFGCLLPPATPVHFKSRCSLSNQKNCVCKLVLS